ncbi:MAG: HAD family hydrolase [Breznakibacter sp.]
MNEINRKFEAVDTIIFDLGGVLVDLDIARTIGAFDQLGLSQLASEINKGHHTGLLAQLEKGLIDENDFFDQIQRLSPHGISIPQIEMAWNAMLVGFPKERVAVLEELKNKKTLLLLSNTNSIHHRHFDGMANGYRSLSLLFHRTWYSYQMKLSKPDPQIFEAVIRHHGLERKTTLFVDDSLANVEAANCLGLQTLHIKPGTSIEDYELLNRQLHSTNL